MVRRKLEKPAFLVPSIPGNTLLWVTKVLKGRLGQNMVVHTCYQISCGFSRYQSCWEWLQYSLSLDLYPQENLVTDSTHLGPDLGKHFKETPLNNHPKYLFSRVTTQNELKGRPTLFAHDFLKSTATSTKELPQITFWLRPQEYPSSIWQK